MSTRPAQPTAGGRAPGKVILLGEHAVVYGGLAVAAPIDRHLTVRLRRREINAAAGGDARLAAALQRAGSLLDVDTSRLEVAVGGNLPAAVGLGSSAALSVALIRAVASLAGRRLSTAGVCAAAFELEKLFHGSPSGVDNTTVSCAEPIAFRAGEFRPIALPSPLPLVVGLGAAPRATATAVAAVRTRRERDADEIDSVFAAIDALARDAEAALAAGRHTAVARLMRCNHELLRALGVSTPELDAMVDLADRHGALGAKLTGGGGGGAVVCVPADDGAVLAAAFRRSGWRAFTTRAGVSPEESHAAIDRTASVVTHASPY